MTTQTDLFAGQTVVVTGAGSGLGRDYALLLARHGASVVVNDLGTSPDGIGDNWTAAEAVVDEIKKAGGAAVASSDSVATVDGGKAIIELAMDSYGRVDALINNAGFNRSEPFEDVDDENLDALIDVHLKSAFYLGRPAFKVMKAQGYGRILFTASSAGVFGAQDSAAYAAAKCGLIGVMNSTALEGAPFNIKTNLLMPVAITRLAGSAPASYMDRISAALGQIDGAKQSAWAPGFVAPLAVYLVSKSCEATQGIFSAALGRYAQVFIGLGQGWFGPTDTPCDVADVAAHFEAISKTTPFSKPLHVAAEFEELVALLKTHQ